MDRLKKIFTDRRLWSIVGAVAIMAVIALVYFYPDAVEGNVLSQYDTRQGIANGQEAKAFTEATGEETRWTNSLFGGMPNFQIAPSYSSNGMFEWIGTVLTLGLPAPAGILFLMMLGFFILLMVMKTRWYIALFGAIAYGFSSYFIILINAGHIWKFITLAYIPPTIAGIILAYRGRYLAGAALTALFGMMQIASNHVQMTYYFLFVVVAIAIACLVQSIKEHNMRRWLAATGSLLVAGVLAVAANLPSLYNTYEYSKETIRGGHSELTVNPDGSSRQSSGDGLDRDYLTAYSYGRSETFTLMIPNVKGGATNLPKQGMGTFLSLADLEQAQEMAAAGEISPETAYYLQQFPQYFGEPEGTNGPVYVGALIFALFIVGCVVVKGPMKWALLIMTLLSILLALGRNFIVLTDLMIDYMPLYNKFRTPESILVIAEFTMPLLGALGLQQLLSGDPREVWDKYGKSLLICFGAVGLICLAGIVAPSLFGSAITEQEMQIGLNQYPELYNAIESLRLGMVRSDSLRSLVILAFGLGIIMLYFRRIVSVGVAALGMTIVVLFDLFALDKRYLNSDCFMPAPISDEEVFTKSVSDEMILADTTQNYRVMDLKRFSSPEPSFYHKAIGGYHAAKLTRYQDMLDYYFSGEKDYTNVLNMLNAKYFIDDPNSAPMINPQAMGNAWLVDKVEYVDSPDAEMQRIESLPLDSIAVADKKFFATLGSSAVKSAGDTIYETTYAPNRLTYHVRSAKGGVAVFSEVYFPWGWHCTIDGNPAELGRVNYLLRAVKVPAGSHTIEMWFDPDSLHTTVSVARTAIILIYLLLIGAALVQLCIKKKNSREVVKTTSNADNKTTSPSED
ncbi:MAG: YfhO family protein [Bacteroides sp.]|nr:YfhO family protein [Bacteroides sp.]MCM1413558.1 YfhO family protein [Bacteroides sp.]MCM1471112.1 YfhO family protein [Bacteroides sp.]